MRGALTSVIRRCIDAPGTFDGDGWLRVGFCGHQPGVGESYISTGSLYLCSVGLLPLGLPASDDFWSAPPAALDVGPRLGRAAVSDRPRPGDLSSADRTHELRNLMNPLNLPRLRS